MTPLSLVPFSELDSFSLCTSANLSFLILNVNVEQPWRYPTLFPQTHDQPDRKIVFPSLPDTCTTLFMDTLYSGPFPSFYFMDLQHSPHGIRVLSHICYLQVCELQKATDISSFIFLHDCSTTEFGTGVREKEVESERGKSKGMAVGKEGIAQQVEVEKNGEIMENVITFKYFRSFFSVRLRSAGICENDDW